MKLKRVHPTRYVESGLYVETLTAPDSTLAVCLFLLTSSTTVPYLKQQDLEEEKINYIDVIQ